MKPELIDSVIGRSSAMEDLSERIHFLSEQFLGTPYEEGTLAGGVDSPEELVVRLDAVDCFTLLDYIEAMRLSSSSEDFIDNLRRVRYRSGKIGFEERHHFFTDWREYDAERTEDITDLLGGNGAVKVAKRLNERRDGSFFVPGIGSERREISYIPGEAIVPSLAARFRTGDYVGIYSPLPGLDVSHVGIIIVKDGRTLLRHASKRYKEVVDEDFGGYASARPGIILLRPRDPLH